MSRLEWRDSHAPGTPADSHAVIGCVPNRCILAVQPFGSGEAGYAFWLPFWSGQALRLDYLG